MESAVKNLGLNNLDDWYCLREIPIAIHLKHLKFPLKLDISEAQINAMIGTRYEEYISSFKNLIKLFKEKEWTE